MGRWKKGYRSLSPLGITFQEKVSKGASHLERAVFSAEEEYVPTAVRLKRIGKGLELRAGFGE